MDINRPEGWIYVICVPIFNFIAQDQCNSFSFLEPFPPEALHPFLYLRFLFIDEIHRFSKSQQDSLLGAVETGVVTLIGATTENPSFEVIRPLLSRCQLYVLKSLEKEDLLELLHNAIAKDVILKEKKIELKETDAMLRFSGGDARKLLNILELVVEAEEPPSACMKCVIWNTMPMTKASPKPYSTSLPTVWATAMRET